MRRTVALFLWFVAVDVARSLGYATPKNPVKRHVDEEDTILLQLSDFQRGSFGLPWKSMS